ncbi:MAG: efflux RND transporter periplasmic adaptor subunit [Boseongicola sp.]|nr:MAG: efflux RND transporter periplasmic adaptor subunit [Boseongicola sp.]
MRVFPIITAIVVVAVLYGLIFERDRLVSFSGATPEASEPDVVTDEPGSQTNAGVSVVAMRSEATSVDGAVVLRGRTEATRQVDIRAETSGRIVSDPLRKGAFVNNGDLVCQLDPGTREIALSDSQARQREAMARVPEAMARLAEAQARLVEAEINDNASSRLSEGGFASETRVAQTTAAVEAARAGVQSAKSGVQAAEAGVQSAEAGVAAAQNELTKLDIAAPFEGLLETDSAELGALLQPGSLCATIIQLDPINLVGFVPETMVDRVQVGAIAGARLASGREIVGKVTFLSRSADPSTRTFRVDVRVPNPDLSIRDGQTAEILIQADGNVAHLLPQSSLTLNDDGDLGVRVVLDGKASFQPVSVLRDTIDGIWVGGLSEVADVIVVGQEYVTDGVAVAATFETEITQ